MGDSVLKDVVENDVERERKYICTRATIEKHLDASLLDHQHIVQSYFPKSFGEMLVPLAVELQLISPEFRELQVTQARLRMVEREAQSTFSLTVKGRLPELLPTERIELPIELKRKTYELLMPYAQEGTITKDRFLCPIESKEVPETLSEKMVLEIDLPRKRYIKGCKAESLSDLKLAFLEIELASRAVDKALRKGFHGISLIHQSLDISKDQEKNEKFRKILSWSRLARKGLSDTKLQKGLSELQTRLN